jgi:hypothetical protein
LAQDAAKAADRNRAAKATLQELEEPDYLVIGHPRYQTGFRKRPCTTVGAHRFGRMPLDTAAAVLRLNGE